jgi:drug/metabolite transporter (DMT)-like permease
MFFLIKDLLDRLPVADFLAVRFTVAAVVMALVAPQSVAALGPRLRRRGVLLGALYGAAQLLQTAGLGLTSASVSGFVTGMYVVLTPVLGALLLGQRVARGVWVAVALATAGLGVLSLRGFAFGVGETLTLAAAAIYALHILGLGRWSRPQDAYGLAVVQMAVIAAVCTVGAVPGGIVLPATTGDWAATLYMALVAADPGRDRHDHGAGVRRGLRRRARRGSGHLAAPRRRRARARGDARRRAAFRRRAGGGRAGGAPRGSGPPTPLTAHPTK